MKNIQRKKISSKKLSSSGKFYQKLQNLIYVERVGRKLSQSDIAGILGISANCYCKKENGKRSFTEFELYRLCRLLDIDLREIL